jgi:tetratricopeptide (TPR) repeat protein
MATISRWQAALSRADEVLDPAWDTKRGDPIRTVLARRALEISPLCADAYVVLAAEAEPGSDREIDLWRSAVQSGQMALGEEYFKECEGEFWYILETRPYMRARLGLALALWQRGEKSEAIDHLCDLLRLNPNDNQGNRYILAAYLVETGRDSDASKLVKEFKEDNGAFFAWTRALLAYRSLGDSAKSRQSLAKALKSNGLVPAYLVGERKPPTRMQDGYSHGDENEAIFYSSDFGHGWQITPGALDWLKTSLSLAKNERGPTTLQSMSSGASRSKKPRRR